MRHFFKARAVAGIVLSLASTALWAQTYPQRPVRLIVPYTAGGATDLLARAVAASLSERLGQQVVSDNRPGANTIIGFQLQAQAAPDGYTLLTGGFNGLVLNPILYKSLPYSVERDIASVAMLGSSPLVVVVHPSLPVRSLAELVKHARANPGKLNFASGGDGNITHVAAEQFMAMTGTKMEHVPYKGGAAGIGDQLSGMVHLKFDTPITALPHVKSGRLRALAVTAKKRMDTTPELPTIAESGYPDYEASTWFSIMTRKGTPRPIIDRLNRDVQQAVAVPELRARFAGLGIELESGTPEALDARVKSDTARWSAVIRKAGVKLDQQ